MENYIVYNELGAGSSRVVYKGRKKGSLAFVALISADKAMKPFIANHVGQFSDVLEVAFRVESWLKTNYQHVNVVSFPWQVYICSKLHHPNVVSFYEWYETNTHLWCVVELCSGQSLLLVVWKFNFAFI